MPFAAPTPVTMIKINVILAGVQRGPFAEETVQKYLDDGILLPTDLAQFDGQTEWKTVTQILEELASRPQERTIRRKRKSSSAKEKAKRRKQIRIGLCVATGLLLILAFIFQDSVVGLYDFLNYTLFQQWAHYFM